MISGLAVILLSWWYPLGTANVFLHDEQMEGLEEELAMKDEGPLEIGTVSYVKISIHLYTFKYFTYWTDKID